MCAKVLRTEVCTGSTKLFFVISLLAMYYFYYILPGCNAIHGNIITIPYLPHTPFYYFLPAPPYLHVYTISCKRKRYFIEVIVYNNVVHDKMPYFVHLYIILGYKAILCSNRVYVYFP